MSQASCSEPLSQPSAGSPGGIRRVKRKPPPEFLNLSELAPAAISTLPATNVDESDKQVAPLTELLLSRSHELYPSPPASPVASFSANRSEFHKRHGRSRAGTFSSFSSPNPPEWRSSSRYDAIGINSGPDDISQNSQSTEVAVVSHHSDPLGPASLDDNQNTRLAASPDSIDHSRASSISHSTSSIDDRTTVRTSFTPSSTHHQASNLGHEKFHETPHYRLKSRDIQPPSPTPVRFTLARLLLPKKSLTNLKVSNPTGTRGSPSSPYLDDWFPTPASPEFDRASIVPSMLPSKLNRRRDRSSETPTYTSVASSSAHSTGSGVPNPETQPNRSPLGATSTPALPLVPNRFRDVSTPSIRQHRKSSSQSSRGRHYFGNASSVRLPDPPPFQQTRLPTEDELHQAASMTVIAESGMRVTFGELWMRQKTVVCFLRHFWCPLCQDYMFSITRNVDPKLLKKQGVSLVIISNGSWNMIKSYRQIFRTPFELYTDPTLRLYTALGMTLRTTDGGPESERGSYVRHGLMSGIKMVVVNAVKVGMPVWEKGGDIGQLGGEFVLGPGLKCSYAHRMQTTRSHAPITKIMAVAGVDLYEHSERFSSTERSFLNLSQEEETKWKVKTRRSVAKLRERSGSSGNMEYPCGPIECQTPSVSPVPPVPPIPPLPPLPLLPQPMVPTSRARKRQAISSTTTDGMGELLAIIEQMGKDELLNTRGTERVPKPQNRFLEVPRPLSPPPKKYEPQRLRATPVKKQPDIQRPPILRKKPTMSPIIKEIIADEMQDEETKQATSEIYEVLANRFTLTLPPDPSTLPKTSADRRMRYY